MSNSPLVSYTRISPNKTSPRKHAIDTITIHCVVGQCSVETLGDIFAAPSRQPSGTMDRCHIHLIFSTNILSDIGYHFANRYYIC